MELTPTGLKTISYKLHPINDSIVGKPEITELIENAKAKVSEKILDLGGSLSINPSHPPAKL